MMKKKIIALAILVAFTTGCTAREIGLSAVGAATLIAGAFVAYDIATKDKDTDQKDDQTPPPPPSKSAQKPAPKISKPNAKNEIAQNSKTPSTNTKNIIAKNNQSKSEASKVNNAKKPLKTVAEQDITTY